MTSICRAALLASALALAWPALAEPTPAPAPSEEDQKVEADQKLEADMYQDALQSIAEGRKNDASSMLMRLVEKEPEHAGAWLEVALLQCGLGHADEAERLFAIVETRFNPPIGILELISNTRAHGCARWQATSSGSVSIGRGTDQNVNQGASNPSYIIERDGGQIELPLAADFLPKHDQYSVLSADYLRDVTPNGSIGFVQFQGRHNDRLSQYDSASLFLGIDTPYRFGRWTMRTTGMLGLVSLGGHFYQRQLQLQARVGPPLPLPASIQFNVIGGFTHTQYLTLTNFNSTTAELRGQLTRRSAELYTSASLGYLDDHANAARPGGNRHGWQANLQARHGLGWGSSGELGYMRQTWASDSAYLPGLIDQARDQQTQVLRGTLVYPVRKNQSLQLEVRLVRNRENISIFSYNNRQIQLSWQWQAP